MCTNFIVVGTILNHAFRRLLPLLLLFQCLLVILRLEGQRHFLIGIISELLQHDLVAGVWFSLDEVSYFFVAGGTRLFFEYWRACSFCGFELVLESFANKVGGLAERRVEQVFRGKCFGLLYGLQLRQFSLAPVQSLDKLGSPGLLVSWLGYQEI